MRLIPLGQGVVPSKGQSHTLPKVTYTLGEAQEVFLKCPSGSILFSCFLPLAHGEQCGVFCKRKKKPTKKKRLTQVLC